MHLDGNWERIALATVIAVALAGVALDLAGTTDSFSNEHPFITTLLAETFLIVAALLFIDDRRDREDRQRLRGAARRVMFALYEDGVKLIMDLAAPEPRRLDERIARYRREIEVTLPLLAARADMVDAYAALHDTADAIDELALAASEPPDPALRKALDCVESIACYVEAWDPGAADDLRPFRESAAKLL